VKRPPKEIYYRGNIDIVDNGRNIAVIGSRHVSDRGIKLSFDTGCRLAAMGINVVNGLALGCDTFALKGALSAGGKCIAVMPCGLDQTVPQSNSRLAEDILSNGGCLISEYPIGMPIEKYMYIERDRLQSGISEGVIVVEAERESGTMHTVSFAMKQGKALACFDSLLTQYSCGNMWLSQRNGVNVIKDGEQLCSFVNGACNTPKYKQMCLPS
jgi:DNA processing protein